MTQIKASDLRIGNLVKEGDTGILFKANIYIISWFLQYNQKDRYSPVPITEELLLKAGFTKTIGFWIKFGDDSFEVSPMDGKWFIYFRNFNKGTLDDFVCLRKDVLYWHTLQNLFYSITGKELTL